MKATRITLVLSMMICLALTTQAEPVNPAQARTAATGFFYERVNQVKEMAAKDLIISEEREVRKEGLLLYYVFNFRNGGWVLVSGDDRLIPVIGYSFEGEYGTKEDLCCHAFWMKNVDDQISAALKENSGAYETATLQWQDLLSRDSRDYPVTKAKAITPLMQSSWEQGKYYNALCPLATGGPDGRALVGCVATSMSQVMYYYRWPLQGLGTHDGINFASYNYRWNEMLNSVSAANQGVAEICYHAGVTVDMSYAADGSGSYTWLIPGAMTSHFRYSADAQFENKSSFSTATWTGMLINNLDELHPVIYSGSDPDAGGHAWVCDGYQGTDYFHMNWGWGGSYDGYFYLNALTAGGSTFSSSQGAVFDLYPLTTSYPVNCTGTTTVNYSRGSIADGSGPASYSNNANCQWLIDPTEVIAKITLDFTNFATESTNDVVTIYDGNSTADPVLGTFSGSTLPPTITTTGDKALVVFTTDGAINNAGWYLEYRSIYPVYCLGSTTLTDPSGAIDDGSGANDYSINQTCRWTITPPNAQTITLSFTEFNVASDDWVKVFDMISGAELQSYVGATLPAQLLCNTGSVLVFFKSDLANNATGWALNYTSTTIGLMENPEFGSFSLYPNPAKDKVMVEFTPTSDQECTVDILTLEGRVMLHKSYKNISGTLKAEFDLSGLSSGMYMLRIAGPNGNLITKLVVE